MCLYPRLIKNRKYTATKKNKGEIPTLKDDRTLWVPIGCGKCIECTKQRANHWRTRLSEEIRNKRLGAQFVTLTFSPDELDRLSKDIINNNSEHEIDNEIATLAIRRFLERCRKDTGKSLKHWLITELGHTNTERIHLHGIIWGSIETIQKNWQYGWIYFGQYVNEQTINYIVKYVTKIDQEHKWFTGKILCSPGIGSNYLKRNDAKLNKFNNNNTNELYYTNKGTTYSLPIYYRNKIYSDEEKEQLWLQKLDKQERYVLGHKIDISNGDCEYYKALKEAQLKNIRLGGQAPVWIKAKYTKSLNILNNIPKHDKNHLNQEIDNSNFGEAKTEESLPTNISNYLKHLENGNFD